MRATLLILTLTSALLGAADTGAQGPVPAAGPAQAAAPPCPAGFEPAPAPKSPDVACRRTVVTWSVTACTDSAYQSYRAVEGPDRCEPTEVAGVGAPPGPARSRSVSCRAAGYAVVADRTGPRDRCERVRVEYAPAARRPQR